MRARIANQDFRSRNRREVKSPQLARLILSTRSMAMHTGESQRSSWMALWRGRRFEYRRRIDVAVIDMRERYGAAAYGIARNSAHARGGPEHRRFWRRVARQLRPGVSARLLMGYRLL
jgi:hypothetical protein